MKDVISLSRAGVRNRIVTLLVLVLGICWVNAWSQQKPAGGRGSRPAVVRSTTSGRSLVVSIVPVTGGPSFATAPNGFSSMQLGAVSSGMGARNAGVAVERRQHSMVVRALFGLKVENPGAQQGTATLSAFLFRLDPAFRHLSGRPEIRHYAPAHRGKSPLRSCKSPSTGSRSPQFGAGRPRSSRRQCGFSGGAELSTT